MNDTCHIGRVCLVVTIVEHGKGDTVAKLYKKEHSHIMLQYTCHGSGTASSELLDYLGLVETERDVVLSLIPCGRINGILERVNHNLQMERPGGGIAFTLRLTALSSYVCQQLEEIDDKEEEEDYIMENDVKYELILAIVNHGFSDKAMHAAKAEGAKGGTIIEARLLGTEEASKFLGITIKEEKEIVAIVAQKEAKTAIMQAINHEVGIRTEGKGILMALPIDNIIGLGDLNTL